MMKEKMKKICSLLVSLIALVLYPCFFLYFHNMSEGKFGELYEAIGKFLLLAFLCVTVTLIIVKELEKAVLISEVAMLFFLNFNTIYTFLKKNIEGLRRPVLLVFILILLLLVTILIKRRFKYSGQVCSFVGIMFGALILLNAVMAMPDIIKRITSPSVESAALVDEISNQEFSTGTKPNVYYFIFDEYAGFENLKYYFDFDNKDFESYLLDKGFNISYSSRNKESILSATIIPNVLNLSYVVDDDVYSYDRWAMTENPKLYQLFENNGYTINMINHLGQLGDENCNVLNYIPKETTLSTTLLNNSIWEEVDEVITAVKIRFKIQPTQYKYILRDTLNLMTECNTYVESGQPTLTVSYVVCPHDYFVFDAEGNFIADDYSVEWHDPHFYIDQLTYLNTRIEETVDNILSSDPNALIIIQADHGARYPYMIQYHFGEPDYDRAVNNPYMQNIINLVYYQGNELDIEGLSGINTWRYVLNEVFGTNYEMLEEPEGYMGPY